MNMKIKSIAIAIVLLFTFAQAQAQKIAIVDIQKVLDATPEYRTANENLDKLSNKWRQDIALEYDKIKGMYNKYQAEQVLLGDEAKKTREDEIVAKEKEVRDLQKAKFGPEGELFKKRQELVKPIQDKVYAAIDRFANSKGFDLIFDRGSSTGLLFSNPTFDKTDDIIKEVAK
jgi:outer membrane protein